MREWDEGPCATASHKRLEFAIPSRRADSFESALLVWSGCGCPLFGGELFLLAFHTHCFELALFGVVRFLDFLLDLRCRLFQLG